VPLDLTTTTALLDGLRDRANTTVWGAFFERYQPLLVGLARRLGLGAEDAADVAQETLLAFTSGVREGRYDRDRGRLRAFVLGIARHKIGDVRQARGARGAVRGESQLQELPGDDELAAMWDAECERVILRKAMAELRSGTELDAKTVELFEDLVVGRAAPAAVAAARGVNVESVYKAKQRCLPRVQEIVVRLRAAFEVA